MKRDINGARGTGIGTYVALGLSLMFAIVLVATAKRDSFVKR